MNFGCASSNCLCCFCTDSRIDTQDRGFCPSFPGWFCSCRVIIFISLPYTPGKLTYWVARPLHSYLQKFVNKGIGICSKRLRHTLLSKYSSIAGRTTEPNASLKLRNTRMFSRVTMRQNVIGLKATSASRFSLSRLRQLGSIAALVLPSGGKAARLRNGIRSERG
ncbi:hypothetical protein T265_08724 [Opisthorchis viverrini]|uniref:Uncharacterized protein n=1 Tax=Opisthorchis viverrini TaxID=6198 RepID=A0A074Z865_OPIVI|nr:hypothetical protein T265_08724 [Opisthorchis viverrini]KER23401.1 hypothetical protein T265_08724 [Opisthorchis viverrini]